MTEGENSAFEVEVNNGRSLGRQLFPCRYWCDRRSRHKSLQGIEAYLISESHEIKVTEYISFAFVSAMSKAVCKGWSRASRCVCYIGSRKVREVDVLNTEGVAADDNHTYVKLWVNGELTDEVEVGVQFTLFRELPTQTGHFKSVLSHIRKTQISLNCRIFFNEVKQI
jgi:hypothetical protein